MAASWGVRTTIMPANVVIGIKLRTAAKKTRYLASRRKCHRVLLSYTPPAVR